MTAFDTHADQALDLLRDLTPACAAHNPATRQPCDQPAAFLVWLIYQGEPLPKVPHCAEHREAAHRHFVSCPDCTRLPLSLHSEPL